MNLNEAFSTTTTNQPLRFSLDCIYCQSKKTAHLTQDGSFRQCLNTSCRKQFQAQILPPTTQIHMPVIKQRHPNEYIMFNQEHLKNQPNQDQDHQGKKIPNTLQQTQYTSFSQPEYDWHISKK